MSTRRRAGALEVDGPTATVVAVDGPEVGSQGARVVSQPDIPPASVSSVMQVRGVTEVKKAGRVKVMLVIRLAAV